MEHVLVEKLVNLRQYPVVLHFELPHDLPTSRQPEVRISQKGVHQLLRPDGLTIEGTLVQTLFERTGGDVQEWEEELYFTYLIPRQDLLEPDLLNLEVQVTVERFHYHLIQKRGQVFLSETIELMVTLNEYHLLESAQCCLGGFQKQTGIFLQQLGEVEERLLRLVPIQLPGDYSLLNRISGMVDGIKTDMTADGCILEFACHIQAEYVTAEQKVSTFFFEKNEYVFFPLAQTWCVPDCRVQPLITLADLSLEGTEELAVLYRITLQFYGEQEVNFFTANPAEMPPGVELKRLEVEQIDWSTAISQIVEESIELAQWPVSQLTGVTGEITGLKIEEGENQLFLSGSVEWDCTYLDIDGRERNYCWMRRVEQMAAIPPGEGKWQVQSAVQVPGWEFKAGVLSFAGLVEHKACRRRKNSLSVLGGVPPELLETRSARFLVTEEIDVGQLSFPGEEKVYLHRYATEITEITGQVTHIEAKVVDGGWMVKGQGELVIYYLTGEGERHFCHSFRFYRYIPHREAVSGSELRLTPVIRLLDQEVLEDGSVVLVHYLLQVHYALYMVGQAELVIGLLPGPGIIRPVFAAGQIRERIEKQVEFSDDWFFLKQVKGIEEVWLDWRDYRVVLTAEGFEFAGELEFRVRYRNRLGRERQKSVPVPVRISKKIISEGVCQEIRVIPLIKGYDYRLTEHPEIVLSVSLEIGYRLVGKFTSLYVRTLPSESTT